MGKCTEGTESLVLDDAGAAGERLACRECRALAVRDSFKFGASVPDHPVRCRSLNENWLTFGNPCDKGAWPLLRTGFRRWPADHDIGRSRQQTTGDLFRELEFPLST